MSFFGGGKKSQPAPAPTPRPVTQKLAAATTPQQQATAAAEEVGKDKRIVRGSARARRGTKLTGPRGLPDEARTGRKTLLGV